MNSCIQFEPVQSGQTVSHYKILEKIGSGGMGCVYKAEDLRLNRLVALKFLGPNLSVDQSALSRFRRESQATAALSHPNLCTLYTIEEHAGEPFMVLELLEGKTLDRLTQGLPIGLEQLVKLATEVARGLEAAHSAGVIHRDIKPSNIFVTNRGDVKILDFGLAKLNMATAWDRGRSPVADATLTRLDSGTLAGTTFGTIAYMSPEQVRAENLDHRTDVFSFGAVLYELTTGQRAFPGDSVGVILDGILNRPPVRPQQLRPEVPPALAFIIDKALEKDRTQRYQSSGDIRADLERIQQDLPPARRPLKALRRPYSVRFLGPAISLVLLVCALGLLRISGWKFPSTSAHRNLQSLAVLPLENLSGDKDQAEFADGMTEELIATLGRLGDIRVISRTSTSQFRGTHKPLPEIARQLNVDAVVEGAILRSKDRVRITARLIQASDDKQLWTNSYERDLHDVLKLQDEVAHSIVNELRGELRKPNRSAFNNSRIINPDAYDAIIEGRYLWNKRDEQSLHKAIQQFQKSIEIEPVNAAAYVGLADSYNALGYGNYLSPADSFLRAKVAASKALEIDPSSADAHASLGYATMYFDWDFNRAENEFQQAIEINPNLASAHQWYAYLLMAKEHPDEARLQIDLARQLDPLSVPINTDMAFTYYYSGHPGEAIRFIRTALSMNPKFPLAHFWLGRIYTAESRYPEALAELKSAEPLRNWQPTMAALGYLYGQWRKAAEVRRILNEFKLLENSDRYVSGYALALVYAGSGDKAEALHRLEQAYSERSHWLVWLKLDPRWNSLRSEPKFKDLVRRVGLPD